LGLVGNVDLLNYDPIRVANAGGAGAADAVTNQIKAAQIANLMVTGAVAVAAAGNGDTNAAGVNILSNLVDAISQVGTGKLDLSSSATLAPILQGVTGDVFQLIVQGNNISATTLQSVYEYQQLVQSDIADAASSGLVGDSLADLKNLLQVISQGQKIVDIRLADGSDTGVSAHDNLTKVPNPYIHLDLASLVSSKSVAVGNQVVVKFGDQVAYQGALTQAQIDAGEVNLSFENLGSDGVKKFTVVISDTVTSKPIASGFMAFTLDTTSPNTPTLTQLQSNQASLAQVGGVDTINIAEASHGLVITGKAESGTQVELHIADRVFAVLSVDNGDGTSNWRADLTASSIKSLGQLSGASVVVVSTDKAGNVSTSVPHLLNADTLAPVVTVTDPVISGNHINLAQASDGSVVLQGSVSVDTQSVTVNLGALQATTVVSGEHWVLKLDATKLAAAVGSVGSSGGLVGVSVTATDFSGNVSTVTGPQLLVDLQVPTTPVVTSITGISGTDVTVTAQEAAHGVSISGLAEANTTVALSIHGNPIAVTQDGTRWTATLSDKQLQDLQGNVTLDVSTTDAVGNVSTHAQQAFTLATFNPAAPKVATPITVDNSVINQQEADAGVILTGSAPAGCVLSFAVDGQALVLPSGALTQNGSVWSLSLTSDVIQRLGQSTHALVATATDVYGNVSTSVPVPFEVDTQAPNVSGPASIGGADGVVSAAEASALTLQGLAEAGSTISLKVLNNDGTPPQTLTVNGNQPLTNPVWTLNLNQQLVDSLGQGGHQLVVEATDAAGNVSRTAPLSFAVDTVAPTSPTIDRPIAGDNIINKVEANASGGVMITGTLPVGNSPQVQFVSATGQVVTYSSATSPAVSVGSDGVSWQLNLHASDITGSSGLGQGNFTLLVKSVDAAGNASAPATAQVAIDTVVSDPGLTLQVPGHNVDGVTYTHDGVVNVSPNGALDVATWAYRVNGGVWKPGTGTDLTVSGDGAKTVEVYQVDAAGNVSATKSVSFTLDTSVAAPVIRLNNDAGSSASDHVTNNGKVLLTNLESHANASWQYSTDSGSHWVNATSGVSADGTSLTLSTDGNYQVRVQQIDAAGNESQWVTTSLTLDKTAPELSIAAISGDGVLSTVEAQKDLVVSGSTTAETGQIVTLTIEDKLHLGAVLKTYTGIVSGGTWSVTVPASDVASFNASTTYQFAASVSDLAGNVSSMPSSDLALAVTNSGLDGYITGATVFVDSNQTAGHLGVLDKGEAVSVTDAVGSFSLPANGPLVMQGGVDVSTGLDFQSKYEASAGYRVINPVTTLVREYEIAHPAATTAGAVLWIKQSGLFGQSGAGNAADLGTYDPFRVATAADNDATVTSADRLAAISYQKVAAELSNVMDVGAAVLQTLKYSGESADSQLAHRQDFSVALIKQIALDASTTNLAHALTDGTTNG